MSEDSRRPLVIIVITLDEAVNIGKAIASVGDRAPVIVIDSGSTDGTQEIARAAGADVIVHEFVDYASQRNFGLGLARERFRWVLFLDADEEFTDELWHDVFEEIEHDDHDGVYIGWTMVMLGHELRHGAFATSSALRLMRPELAQFVRGTNERVDDHDLRVTRLRHTIRHDDHKPLSAWFRKHVRYAEREARLYFEGADDRGLEGLSLTTKGGRALAIRWAYNKLPLFVRPFLNLGRCVVVLGGWRDGFPGLMVAGMQAFWFPMLLDLLIYEHRLALRDVPREPKRRPTPPPLVALSEGKRPLVVIVLTLDEASNIEKAIASVGEHAPVIVIDSHSTDGTQRLAREAGAEVVENDFVDYASQRNFALDLARDRFRWVFFLDADEEIPAELWRDINAIVSCDEHDAAYVRRTFAVLGRELEHGLFGSTRIMKLMRPESGRWSRPTHERVDDRGMRVTTLRHKVRQDDRKSIAEWFRKHIRYAEREASHYFSGEDDIRTLRDLRLGTVGGRKLARRWAYNRLPLFLRSFARFGRTAFLHSAWLDGFSGMVYASMQSLWYPLMIDLFIYERRRATKRS